MKCCKTEGPFYISNKDPSQTHLPRLLLSDYIVYAVNSLMFVGINMINVCVCVFETKMGGLAGINIYDLSSGLVIVILVYLCDLCLWGIYICDLEMVGEINQINPLQMLINLQYTAF